MALFLVASCLGISSSMKGELGIRIKFFSFLLYFFLASLNNFLMLIKYRESERLEGIRLPCCINLLVRISRSLFKNALKLSKKSRVIKLTYIIHSGFISGYQNRYGDNLKPPTNVYHRMTA